MIMKEPVLKTMRSLVGFPARMPPYTQMLSPTAAALCLRLLRATPLIAKHSQVRDTVRQWKCHHSAVWLCFILPQCKRQQKGQAQTKLMASSCSSTSCNTLTCHLPMSNLQTPGRHTLASGLDVPPNRYNFPFTTLQEKQDYD